jgi:hypothetical protein
MIGKFRYTKIFTSPEGDYYLIRKGGDKPNRKVYPYNREFIANGGEEYIDEYTVENPNYLLLDENNVPYLNPQWENICSERQKIGLELQKQEKYRELCDPITNEIERKTLLKKQGLIEYSDEEYNEDINKLHLATMEVKRMFEEI